MLATLTGFGDYSVHGLQVHFSLGKMGVRETSGLPTLLPTTIVNVFVCVWRASLWCVIVNTSSRYVCGHKGQSSQICIHELLKGAWYPGEVKMHVVDLKHLLNSLSSPSYPFCIATFGCYCATPRKILPAHIYTCSSGPIAVCITVCPTQ